MCPCLLMPLRSATNLTLMVLKHFILPKKWAIHSIFSTAMAASNV